METNFLLINDPEKANPVNKNFSEEFIDGTNTYKEELIKYLEGAINLKGKVFIKTDKRILKIDREKIPEFLNSLREKLASKEEYKVTGIGLDTSTNENKVSFTKSLLAERKDVINDADQMLIKFENIAGKEYVQEIRNALQIANQEKRSGALQQSAVNFETVIKKAGQEFIIDIKKANTTYLKNVQSAASEHYPEIKKASGENIKIRENAVNSSINALIQAIQIHIDSMKAAINLKNASERETAFTEAYVVYYNNIDKIQKDYDSAVEIADSRFIAMFAHDRNGADAAVVKAESQSRDAINEDEQTINIAYRKAKKEYDLAVREALQIANPEKRYEALKEAQANFETTVRKAGEEFIGDIRKGTLIYLDYIKAIDPVHYPEIKKAVEESINFRENAVNSSYNASIQAIKIHIDAVTTASNLNNSQEHEMALIKADTDLSNKLLTWRNIMLELLKTLTVNIPPP